METLEDEIDKLKEEMANLQKGDFRPVKQNQIEEEEVTANFSQKKNKPTAVRSAAPPRKKI